MSRVRRLFRYAWLVTVGLSAPSAHAQSGPCDAPAFREFDFWLGPWIVTDSTNAEVGRNEIVSVQRGCVLMEHWTGADGSTGSSFNIYDRFAKRWHQTWVDANGLLLQLDGNLVNDNMVLGGTRVSPSGAPMRHRITWIPHRDGSVTQHWERSADGGRSWITQFKGMYRRRR